MCKNINNSNKIIILVICFVYTFKVSANLGKLFKIFTKYFTIIIIVNKLNGEYGR